MNVGRTLPVKGCSIEFQPLLSHADRSGYPSIELCALPSVLVPLHLQVTPSPIPNSWRLRDVFIVTIVYGLYLTLSTWLLYHVRES